MAESKRRRCTRCGGIGRVPVHLAFAGICPACHGNGWVWAEQEGRKGDERGL